MDWCVCACARQDEIGKGTKEHCCTVYLTILIINQPVFCFDTSIVLFLSVIEQFSSIALINVLILIF